MHAALGGVDVVGKGDDGIGIAVVILHGHLHGGVVLGALHVDDLLVEGGLVLVEPGDVLPDAPLVVEGVLGLLAGAPVKDPDLQPRVKERLLLHAGVDGLVVKHRGVEHLAVGLEGDGGAGVVRLPHHLHRLRDIPPGKFHFIDLPVLVDLDGEPLAEGVHHAGAHAVEAAGDLVAPAAELAAGVEDGEHHLQGRKPRLGLDVHGDAAAVVGDGDGVAFVDGDGDLGAVAGQGLVNGVVHDLIHQVVEPRLAGRADIHARALADGLQALQDLDLRAAVLVLHLGGGQLLGVALFQNICHKGFPPCLFLAFPAAPPARGGTAHSRQGRGPAGPLRHDFQTQFLICGGHKPPCCSAPPEPHGLTV